MIKQNRKTTCYNMPIFKKKIQMHTTKENLPYIAK